jgi:ABC-2 type transport system ATP-binding protein
MEIEPVLEISGLTIDYGPRRVLRALNLTIGRGEIFGLLGPNGAGKTTLIRTICGRTRAVDGTVTVMGQKLGRRTSKHIGLAPQEIALFPHLTVGENLEVFGRLSGLNQAETKAAVVWAAEATKVVERIRDRVEVLSGGWKRRLNIAAAIMHRPELLILDEPTAGVDIDARNSLHEVVQQLGQSGMSVLVATHDLDQAEHLCDRVGFLRNGKIAPIGHPRLLIEEVFGRQEEIVVQLNERPTAAQVCVLDQAGFSSIGGSFNWSSLTEKSDRSVGDLSNLMDHVGLSAKEITLRKPGLDTLFLRLSHGNPKHDEIT